MATNRAEIYPAVILGRLVLRGTRIPAEQIICKLNAGASGADRLDAHPHLACEDSRLHWPMP